MRKAGRYPDDWLGVDPSSGAIRLPPVSREGTATGTSLTAPIEAGRHFCIGLHSGRDSNPALLPLKALFLAELSLSADRYSLRFGTQVTGDLCRKQFLLAWLWIAPLDPGADGRFQKLGVLFQLREGFG